MNSPEKIIESIGPCSSSRVVAYLVEKEELSREAARKRISRFPSTIRRLRKGFSNRECFLYLEKQWKSPEYFERLIAAIKESGGALGRSIIALESRGGLIDQMNFPAAAGLPIKPVKKQLSYETVKNLLLELELIVLDPIQERTFVRISYSDNDPGRRRAVEMAESMALSSLKPWLVKLGFSSSKKISIRGDNSSPSFGPFEWDIVGPTYLAGIAPRSKDGVKNGFIVGDVILGKVLSTTDLISFFHKCDTIRAQKKHRNFLPILVADRLEESALMDLRKRGFVIGTTTNLFGEDIAKALRELISTLCHAAAAVTQNPDSVFELLGRLNKIEGASLNLRGVVLELIIGRLFSIKGYNIDIRQRARASNGQEAEIDVKATNAKEVVCVECKAKAPGKLVELDELQEWVEEKLPRIKNWLGQFHSLPQKKRFEFCASGNYTEEAREYADKVATQHRKQPVSFLTGCHIIDALREYEQGSIVRIFNEQFTQQ